MRVKHPKIAGGDVGEALDYDFLFNRVGLRGMVD